ncbi:hypothetical protein OJAV_G00049760 [Oryzias javanicus]|uniref:Methyltransferase type 11 domain-containing protein n=1 Tax=Oryzias javanicus TaxID=123683 RepID=A0A3S2MSU6_ORYJA|nr:hypothetical protein OJAV_G00049760 [Oryzias javanicus]
MSVFIRFWASLVSVLCCPLHVIKALGLYEGYKRIFPFCCDRITGMYNKKMHERKQQLFRSLSEFAPARGPLTILEVGCGTGANFQFYPAGCRVICTDPNPHFQKYLQSNIEKNDHLTYDAFAVASGEDLRAFADESVDVVVCTLVLCSVSDVTATLREAVRVLRPGGAFFFLEHVAADPSSWTYFFQHVLQPAWYYFGDGCEVTRESWKNLENAGFSDLKLRHIEAPLAFIIRPHIVGYGVK